MLVAGRTRGVAKLGRKKSSAARTRGPGPASLHCVDETSWLAFAAHRRRRTGAGKRLVLVTWRRLIRSLEAANGSPMSMWVRLPPAHLAARPVGDAPPDFSGKRLVPSGPRRACPVSGRSARRVPCRDSEPGRDRVVVAQRVEHQADNLGVTGSTPVHNTPQPANNRLLGDARNVSTWARGERSAGSVGSRLDSSALRDATARRVQREWAP